MEYVFRAFPRILGVQCREESLLSQSSFFLTKKGRGIKVCQERLNEPFLNGLFSMGFSRGKTAHSGIRGNGPLTLRGCFWAPFMVENNPSEKAH